jgi:hypothetical protein
MYTCTTSHTNRLLLGPLCCSDDCNGNAGLCDEIVQLFGAGSVISDNCKTVVSWAKNMHVTTKQILSNKFALM